MRPKDMKIQPWKSARALALVPWSPQPSSSFCHLLPFRSYPWEGHRSPSYRVPPEERTCMVSDT